MAIARSPVLLVLGGARSGKSRRALAVARLWAEGRRGVQVEVEGESRAAVADRGCLFVATAEPVDDEMRARIAMHRRERPAVFRTVEAPLDPASALRRHGSETAVAVVDCLTVWLGNLLHHRGAPPPGTRVRVAFAEAAALLDLVTDAPCPLVLVSNEVGLGVVPDSALGRTFRDLAGELNQELAALASDVELVTAGLPQRLKGSGVADGR